MEAAQTPRGVLTHVGGWKLGKTLGRGAYAHVRLATHKNGHQAACKILPALHKDPEVPVTWDETIDAVEAHKEVVLLKALCGAGVEGIAGLEGMVEEGGWTYVFLTLYPCSISSLSKPWTSDAVVIFFRRLLHTVRNLHQLNVSHEDIKRSNVLADSQGFPMLVDFGFSHFKANGGYVKSAGGTLDYSSPEKTADKHYDPKANDVWALGILLTKILGIQHPYAHSYADDTSTTVKRRILTGDAKFHWKPDQLVPGGIAELVMGMLERDPQKRWTTMRILRHPWLRTKYPDPKPFQLPSYELRLLHRPSQGVIEDLCFLAYLNGEFALCETSLRIEELLEGKEPCWEKRWAGMLGSWSQRAEMDWQDIPTAITPLLKSRNSFTHVNGPTKAKGVEKSKGGILKEIHLLPNAQDPIPSGSNADIKKGLRPVRSRFYNMKNKDGAQNLLVCSLRPDIQIQTIHTQTVPQEKFVPDELMAITNNQAGKAKSGIVRIKKTKAKQKSKANFKIFISDTDNSGEGDEMIEKQQNQQGPRKLDKTGAKNPIASKSPTSATMVTVSKVGSVTSVPDEQMKGSYEFSRLGPLTRPSGLFLSKPDPPRAQRRSPRLQEEKRVDLN
ncbi:CAMK/CAMKL protein kinase [Cryptococcus neoformans]|uniref:CAMK/CAMKL/SNRK protein kinase n=1 Tax=Cryptococcus neoformans Tu259-1 TaxID=1230072 RepID=A0A854Q676_CRYNE|nr:CAMK/CAMKL/SNRK protein kinase [Cryptococcus neoformans var. grubii 125.91]OXG13032.1 CAMK/CAMKL/SNRK protein kinase [Cryptococcus neoformans var. grubii Tu259-1]OXG27538.1 CAMK/CAMKL/SNRK protein kinase [Cryptococcus neoformans var. grubii Bt15]OXG34377.1 CAMK/CAMKL/SNRK protein kinase [Cryptococcus neoformans var. grubii Bt120]OXG46083.1 CAMK/CAMKL/SNRK protein kinase [Cryptococcus neoformans var. grubii Th84]OXG79380.1 CAMK/CAMKL/SNRK protein kinase [Cryptococcus neoformans var. grubii D